MAEYPINSVDLGVINEGSWIGTPAVIVRFQGCQVGCHNCDARETWELRGDHRIPKIELVKKRAFDSPLWGTLSLEDLVDVIRFRHAPPYTVLLTGGEPLLYEMEEICSALHDLGFQTVLETSGTCLYKLPAFVWVRCCPKFRRPGGLQVHSDSLSRADEVCMLVETAQDLRDFDLAMEWIDEDVQEIYLQPVSDNLDALELCAAACIEKGWKLSQKTSRLLAR